MVQKQFWAGVNICELKKPFRIISYFCQLKVDINNAIEIIKPLANEGNPDAIYNLRIYYKKNNDLKEYEYWNLVCKKTNGCDL